jgi:hypothetical protein
MNRKSLNEMAPIRTQHFKSVINPESASAAYEYLSRNIDWDDGVRSRRGFTRKAKMWTDELSEKHAIVDNIIATVMNELGVSFYFGVYLNYYRDGNDYTPSHSHKGTLQLIISLGASRILKVGQKDYVTENGDVTVFGSSSHGVPKSEDSTGRISIAVFVPN